MTQPAPISPVSVLTPVQPAMPTAPPAQVVAPIAPVVMDPSTDTKPELDLTATILTLAQLRQAVLDEAELTQEDIDTLKMVEKVDLHGIEINLGKIFPGTEFVGIADDGVTPIPAPLEAQHYVFSIFMGGSHDNDDSFIPGDVRVYTLPMKVNDPKARVYRMFTFSRVTATAYARELMTQATFVSEIASEWMDALDAANPDDENE